jgi:hypothetical protein
LQRDYVIFKKEKAKAKACPRLGVGLHTWLHVVARILAAHTAEKKLASNDGDWPHLGGIVKLVRDLSTEVVIKEV